jgi:hypothetical protein
MKAFTVEFRRLFQQGKEQSAALSLSLLIHFALLFGVNLLASWPQNAFRFELRQMTFDFNTNPAGELNRTAKANKRRPARQSSALSVSSAGAGGFISRETMQNVAPAAATANSNPGQLELGTAATATATSLRPTYSDLARPLPNTARVTSKLIPYKLAVPSPQRHAILKKVKDLAANSNLPMNFDSSFVWDKNGQRFHFDVHHLPASTATGYDELLVSVNTFDGDDTLSTQMRLKRLGFSQFAQFVDYWDPQVALHDDEFDGRFHSNSAMIISSSGGTQPKFHGKVSMAAYSIRRSEQFFYLDDSKVFLAGLEQGAASIPLPRVFFGIPRDTSRGAGRVQMLAEESWITFHADGSYSLRAASSPGVERHAKLSREPHTIIGSGKAKLHLKGTVRGALLIYSENDLIIDGDLLYANDPEIFPDSGDFLGLVSAKDIEVAPPTVTGLGDLKIYAALLAKGRFRVPHLYTRETGTLRLYGSLSAGSITATEPRYATRIRFDKRFDKMRPPNFPMTNQYEIAEWDERWIVK